MSGFVSGLAVLFIALRILGLIDWSWWWVLSPLWGGAILGLAAFSYGFSRMAARSRMASRRWPR